MTQQYHFIAGLPRSGSTLLASILSQNPAISAGITGPAAAIFTAMQRAISQGNEAANFLNNDQRSALLRAALTSCHNGPQHIVFDTNRSWPTKINILATLFPECRIVCCVRDIAWVVDSIERLVRKNVYDLSGIFNFQPNMTVFDRARALTEGGLVGSANVAMMEAAYGEHADRLLLVEYDALTTHPLDTLVAIYQFLNLPYYERHDYQAIKQVPGAAEFDRRMGTPGLHDLGPTVKRIERQTILPPEIFNSFGTPFWRAGTAKVNVIQNLVKEE